MEVGHGPPSISPVFSARIAYPIDRVRGVPAPRRRHARRGGALSLAQPTVSGLLRRLSETVGDPVLLTKGGHVELTRAGQDVALLCEEIFESLARFDKKRAA